MSKNRFLTKFQIILFLINDKSVLNIYMPTQNWTDRILSIILQHKLLLLV